MHTHIQCMSVCMYIPLSSKPLAIHSMRARDESSVESGRWTSRCLTNRTRGSPAASPTTSLARRKPTQKRPSSECGWRAARPSRWLHTPPTDPSLYQFSPIAVTMAWSWIYVNVAMKIWTVKPFLSLSGLTRFLCVSSSLPNKPGFDLWRKFREVTDNDENGHLYVISLCCVCT